MTIAAEKKIGANVGWVKAGAAEEIARKGVVVVQAADRPVAVFAVDEAGGTGGAAGVGGVGGDGCEFRAVDNRCPHLGFPLHKGTLKDGILTCQWHQARFDVCSGCTFDQWADDVPGYETKVEAGTVWVGAMPRERADRAYHLRRLETGMRQNVVLLMAKAIVGLLHVGVKPLEILREIARYAAREATMPTGLTELAITGNLLPVLSEETAYFFLLRGARVIAQAAMGAKRVELEPLGGEHDADSLKRWYRQWAAARERDGMERILRTAVAECEPAQVAEIMFTTHNDQVYRSQGHAFDVANKQMEVLDLVGWDSANAILPLALDQTGMGRGIEESAAWHEPIEILAPLLEAQRTLEALEPAWRKRSAPANENSHPPLEILLSDDPLAIIAALQTGLATGHPEAVSKQVAYAAAMRLARFANSNEVGDWFNPQHTFTFANAVHQAVKRCPTAGVVRAVFHAALSVYQDRFLNVPPAKLSGETKASREAIEALPTDSDALRKMLLEALERQSNGDAAAQIAVRYLRLGNLIGPLVDTLALATVREDLDFHTLQVLEAGYQLAKGWEGRPEAEHLFVAITRDLAAFCPTRRAQLKTAITALKLDRGDKVYEEEKEG